LNNAAVKTPSLRPFDAPHRIEAGCDEAGRGCLAGPVFAAAVVLPSDFFHPLLNDSKQLSEATRRALRPVIEQQALAWSVASCTSDEIDRTNILRASIAAMHRALAALSPAPAFILVDGNRFLPFGNVPHRCVVHGDALFASIAAASVLAKTHRDDYMQELARQFPQYGWPQNKGYPTRAHRQAIRLHGPSPYHRRTFRLLND
jgi:ribonuclease HII